jgi:2'-5' RNA ligase
MENQYYRTFIGLPLQVEQSFLEARKDLLAAFRDERISWTLPEQYHVTLRFLGETERDTVEAIGQALQNEVSLPGQSRQILRGLGSFGPRKRPRVLWVGFEEGDFFDLLKQEVDRALESCGIPGEKQPFRAHLTLGRVRSLKNLNEYYQTVEQMRERFMASVLFDRLVFFRSILGPGGPEYQKLKKLQFPG